VHCDFSPRTAWNFITLCSRGYYDGLAFHRLVGAAAVLLLWWWWWLLWWLLLLVMWLL
jgi:hypothetical protein